MQLFFLFPVSCQKIDITSSWLQKISRGYLLYLKSYEDRKAEKSHVNYCILTLMYFWKLENYSIKVKFCNAESNIVYPFSASSLSRDA